MIRYIIMGACGITIRMHMRLVVKQHKMCKTLKKQLGNYKKHSGEIHSRIGPYTLGKTSEMGNGKKLQKMLEKHKCFLYINTEFENWLWAC